MLLAAAVCFSATAVSSQFNTKVKEIFQQNCSTSGCHEGRYPPMGLDLEQNKYLDSTVNIPSRQKEDFKIVAPGNPEESYLYLKITGSDKIDGQKMPAQSPPLGQESIGLIRQWIQNYDFNTEKGRTKENLIQNPVFWAPHIINLPTSRSIGKNNWVFKVSHRFLPSVSEGYAATYGLDGPASVLVSFGYGLNKDIGMTISRISALKEFELAFHWTFSRQGENNALPIDMAVSAGSNIITDTPAGESAFQSEFLRFHLQLCLAHRFSESLSIELVPGYSSNSNPGINSSQGSFSLGLGGRFMIFNNFSFLLELIPVISGYKADFTGWSAGFEKKIGGHVFQVFILNSTGLTAPQYLPGGDLDLFAGDFRLGFSIYRWF